MDYNNFEIRGISTNFKEIVNLFETFVQLGKPTMFELVELKVVGGMVNQKQVLRSTS
jgi:hypothetical protein